VNERELVDALAALAVEIRNNSKTLSSPITWHIYGTEANYIVMIDSKSADDGLVEAKAKSRLDWETYVLLEGAGALQGRMTGNPDRKGGVYTGGLEERRNMHFIHQLLAPNFSTLKARCEIRHTALSARGHLMTDEPHRTAAILFYQEYLRVMYQSTSGDSSLIAKHLKMFPGVKSPADLLAEWEAVETKLKREKPSSLFEVKNGQFYVYEKVGKEKRLVNGWLFGAEKQEDDLDDNVGADEKTSQYEREIDGAGFHMRMKMLQAEIQLVIGNHASDLVSLIADHKSGTLPKILASIERFADVNIKDLPESQKKMIKSLTDYGEKTARLATGHPKIISALGIRMEDLTAGAMRAQKIKRKM